MRIRDESPWHAGSWDHTKHLQHLAKGQITFQNISVPLIARALLPSSSQYRISAAVHHLVESFQGEISNPNPNAVCEAEARPPRERIGDFHMSKADAIYFQHPLPWFGAGTFRCKRRGSCTTSHCYYWSKQTMAATIKKSFCPSFVLLSPADMMCLLPSLFALEIVETCQHLRVF
jgi:hypothetical protein